MLRLSAISRRNSIVQTLVPFTYVIDSATDFPITSTESEFVSPGITPNHNKENKIVLSTTDLATLDKKDELQEAPPNYQRAQTTLQSSATKKTVSLYDRGIRNEKKKRTTDKRKEPEFNFFESKHKTFITSTYLLTGSRVSIQQLGFLQWLLSKSKAIKEFLESQSIGMNYVNKQVLQDNHFFMCNPSSSIFTNLPHLRPTGFTGMLDNMYKRKEITSDLKSLNKQAFAKLEQFVQAKVEARKTVDRINHLKRGTIIITPPALTRYRKVQ